MRLADLPAGATVFLDANCLIYHFTGTFPSCALLLERVWRREVRGVTSAATLLEVRHRLMVFEAAQRLRRPLREVPSFLKRHPEVIQTLSGVQQAVKQLQAFRIRVLPVTRRLVLDAHRVSHELGLLTTDALIVATMRAARITHLASNDTDFTRVPGLTLWRP